MAHIDISCIIEHSRVASRISNVWRLMYRLTFVICRPRQILKCFHMCLAQIMVGGIVMDLGFLYSYVVYLIGRLMDESCPLFSLRTITIHRSIATRCFLRIITVFRDVRMIKWTNDLNLLYEVGWIFVVLLLVICVSKPFSMAPDLAHVVEYLRISRYLLFGKTPVSLPR